MWPQITEGALYDITVNAYFIKLNLKSKGAKGGEEGHLLTFQLFFSLVGLNETSRTTAID